jgi:tetratricopeptide (TPR) repeat protein
MQRTLYLLALSSLIVMLQACASKKSVVTSTASKTASFSPEESNLFFDAENERLNGDAKNAIGLYANLLTRYPANATAHYRLGMLYFQRQEIALAETHAAKALALQPDNKFMADFYVQVLAYQKKSKQAEQVLNELIEKNPKDFDYLYKKAMFQLRNKQFEPALKSLKEYESKIGFNEELVLQRKTIYQTIGQYDAAEAEMLTLCNTYPESVQYRIMLLDIYEQGKKTDKAKAMYETLETQFVADPIAQVALAQHYLSLNQFAKYDQYMQQVMQNKNLDVDTKIGLLMPSLQKMDNSSESEKAKIQQLAFSIWQEAPDNAVANGLYADILYFNRQSDSALPYYTRSLEKDPGKLSNWHQVLAIYTEKQKTDSVLAVAQRALLLFPNDPTIYFYQGLAYSLAKKTQAAETTLKRVIDLEPENPVLIGQAYAALGDLYNQDARYAESDSSFERALRLNPQDATTMNNYAYYLSLRNTRLSDAEKMSKRSLEIAPNTPSFLDTYAWILFLQKRYADALIWMEKCMAVSSDPDETLLDHYGDILFRNGKTTDAKTNWLKARGISTTPANYDKKIKEGLPNE